MENFYTITYRGGVAASQLNPDLENSLATIEKQFPNRDDDSWISLLTIVPRFVSFPSLNMPIRFYDAVSSSLATRMGRWTIPLGYLINLWKLGPSEGSSPPTDRPAASDLASATVIASTAPHADGLATAAPVLGLDKAQALIAGPPTRKGCLSSACSPVSFAPLPVRDGQGPCRSEAAACSPARP